MQRSYGTRYPRERWYHHPSHPSHSLYPSPRHSLSKKFIVFPFFWIVDDVLGNFFEGACIANDAVVETGLPSDGQIHAVAIFGYGGFVGSDYRGNGIWFWGNVGHFFVFR